MFFRSLSSIAKQIKPKVFKQFKQGSLEKSIFLQCLVVDDGSKEKLLISEELKELFSRQNFSLTLIRLDKNYGVAKARNEGILRAEGEWISFLDSDDEWKRDKLLKQYDFIKKNPHYKILQSEEIWIRNGQRVLPPKKLLKKEGDIFFLSLENCMITPSSVVIKKELLREEKFNEKMLACEDYDLWLRITLFHPVGLIREKLLIRYAGHPGQLSCQYPVMDFFRVKALSNLKKKLNKIDFLGYQFSLNFLERQKSVELEMVQNFKKKIDLIFYKKINLIKSGAKKRKRYFFLLKVFFLELLYPK